MKTTFLNLQQTATVNPQDVIDTLLEYAESGAAISGHVVTEIVGRTEFSADQLKEVLTAAEKGAEVHLNMSRNTSYQHVPSEVQASALRPGGVSLLEVLDHEEQATNEKKVAEVGESAEYQDVAKFVRGLLAQTEAL